MSSKTCIKPKLKARRHVLRTCEYHVSIDVQGSVGYERCGKPSYTRWELPDEKGKFNEMHLCPEHDLVVAQEEEDC